MKKLKMVVKLLLPPIIYELYRKIRTRKYPTLNTHEGIFNSLNDITDATGYDSKQSLKDTYIETIQKFNESKSKAGLPKANLLSQINNLFPLIVATLKESQERVTILDYGGGMGTSYIDCINAINTDNIDYYIIDLLETMEMGFRLFRGQIKFIEKISDIEKLDIIYLGSVLQYIDDHSSLLEKLIEKKPSFIFLTNHRFGKAETYFTVQVNMPGRRIPIKIIQLEKIISLFGENDYPLIYKSVNHQPYHQFQNIPEEYRVNDSCNLLFARSDI